VIALNDNISQRPVGSKSKDYWDNDKNNLSKLKAGGWRDTAG
jgi:hypothetical protein